MVSSDHRLIEYKLNAGHLAKYSKPAKRYNIKKADWNRFNATLEQEVAWYENEFLAGNIDKKVHIMQKVIGNAAKLAIPWGREINRPKPPWWDDKLQEIKRRVRSANKLYERNKVDNENIFKERYKRIRNEYTKALREKKRVSWRVFATSINYDEWGKCYKWLKTGGKQTNVITTKLKADGTYTKDAKDTVTYMLESMIPTEDAGLPITLDEEEDTSVEEEIDEGIIKQALWRIGTRKAPGEDAINA
ncbi:uncharacterized protein LOC126910029, partial [Daktulosphaira vitifoliae]